MVRWAACYGRSVQDPKDCHGIQPRYREGLKYYKKAVLDNRYHSVLVLEYGYDAFAKTSYAGPALDLQHKLKLAYEAMKSLISFQSPRSPHQYSQQSPQTVNSSLVSIDVNVRRLLDIRHPGQRKSLAMLALVLIDQSFQSPRRCRGSQIAPPSRTPMTV